MTSQVRSIIAVLIAGAATVVLLGCSISGISISTIDTGETQNDPVSIEAGGAQSARVDLRMAGGELTVDRGATALVEGEFIYNVSAWKPEVSYDVTNGEGRLTIRQPNTDRINISADTRNEWNLNFSDAIPLDMRIEVGAGRHDVDLAGLQITRLDMRLGAGDATINLSDNANISDVQFDIGAGSVDIDLNGAFNEDVEVDIQGGVGKTTLRLPSDVGVRVEVTRGIGSVNATGLTQAGDVYTNAAYGDSSATLDIRIRAGVGEIDLLSSN